MKRRRDVWSTLHVKLSPLNLACHQDSGVPSSDIMGQDRRSASNPVQHGPHSCLFVYWGLRARKQRGGHTPGLKKSTQKARTLEYKKHIQHHSKAHDCRQYLALFLDGGRHEAGVAAPAADKGPPEETGTGEEQQCGAGAHVRLQPYHPRDVKPHL